MRVRLVFLCPSRIPLQPLDTVIELARLISECSQFGSLFWDRSQFGIMYRLLGKHSESDVIDICVICLSRDFF